MFMILGFIYIYALVTAMVSVWMLDMTNEVDY